MLRKILLVSLLFCNVAIAQDQSGIKFFNDNILPVLQTKCYSCHSSAAKDTKGALALDTRQGVLNG